MVLIIATKWSRIEIIALAIGDAEGENLNPWAKKKEKK